MTQTNQISNKLARLYMAAGPEKLRDYVESETRNIEALTVRKGVNHDSISEYIRKDAELFSPIKDACRSIHKIRVAMLGNGSEDLVPLITGAAVLPVKKSYFEGLNLNRSLFMPLSQALGEKKH